MSTAALTSVEPAASPAAASVIAPAVVPAVSTKVNYAIDDFEKEKMVGKGAKSRIWLARRKGTSEYYALKEVDIALVTTKQEAQHLWNERDVLMELSKREPPFARANRLHGTIKVDRAIYFVLEFVRGAPLHEHFRRAKRAGGRGFDEERTRFYCAELIETISALHRMGFIYRDLKASNVMLDARTGRIKLVDFGFAKKMDSSSGLGPCGVEKLSLRRTRSVCGTFHAMAPEVRMLEESVTAEAWGATVEEELDGYTQAVDWWSLGVLVYEMLTAEAPFGYRDGTRDPDSTVKELSFGSPGTIIFPDHIGELARSFICELLQVDPERRLGGQQGREEICAHPWFEGFDWSRVQLEKASELIGRPGRRAKPGGPPEFDRALGEYPPSDGESTGSEEESDDDT